MTELKLLNHEDWRLVKTIRLEKQFGSRYMWAELAYARKVTRDYIKTFEKVEAPNGLFLDVKEIYPIDTFDNIVLKAVRTEYPNANFQNSEVLTDMDVTREKALFGYQHKEEAVIYLRPSFQDVDMWSVPDGTRYEMFRIPLSIYIPCEEFKQFFCNEGYTLYYDRSQENNVRNLLRDIRPTVHQLDELIK